MTTVHATSIAIRGQAILIEGPSGSGKSDLALRLIDRGATLISDDYTQLDRDRGGGAADRLIASAPATIAGRMEVRGIGIVAMPPAPPCPVALLVRAGTPERMPEPTSCAMLGIDVPMIILPLTESSAPLKVELALAALEIARS